MNTIRNANSIYFFILLAFVFFYCYAQPAEDEKRQKRDDPNHASKLNAIQIVEKMCTEYKRYRFENPPIPGTAPKSPQQANCLNIKNLADGGTVAEPKEFPHMALLGFSVPNTDRVEWLCGASLISDRFVLSAASCRDSRKEAKWVRLGGLTRDSENDKGKPVVFSIVERFDHPEYKPPLVYNDITLFRLNDSVKFNAYVRPICLSTSTLSFPYGTNVSITGWGKTETTGRLSENLSKGVIQLNNSKVCNDSYRKQVRQFSYGFDDNSMLCAGNLVAGKYSCSGDGGGPLQILEDFDFCSWRQLGITSVGPTVCEDDKVPGIYTKVSNYVEWIQSIVWPNP